MRKSSFGLLAVLSLGGPMVLLGGWMLLGLETHGGSKDQRVFADFRSMDAALKAYWINAGEPPATHQGFEALVTMPTTAPVPKRWVQITKKKPLDPWETEYQYRRLPAAPGSFRYELRSAGPDGVFGNADDFFDWFGG